MMPPRVKKTCEKKSKVSSGTLINDEQIENEKENKLPKPETRKRRNVKKLIEIQFEDTETDLSTPLPELSKSNTKTKQLGFWSKKLKDLEQNVKNKKNGLYEFSVTDESETSYKRKKKPKPKIRVKKKQPVVVKQFHLIEKPSTLPKSKAKAKKIHSQSLCREQIVLSKERKKLAEKGEKFTFSTGMPSLGITSTPAVNKDNLVGASNFLFLSPINKEVEDHKDKSMINDKDPTVVHLGQETPKVETKLKRISCRRVLRSGKILNT